MTKKRFQKQRIRSLAAQLNVSYTDAKKYLQQLEAQELFTLRNFPNPPTYVPKTTTPLLLGYTTAQYDAAPWLQFHKVLDNILTVAWDTAKSETPVLSIQGGAGTGKTYYIDAIEHSLVQHNAPCLRIDGVTHGTTSISPHDNATSLLHTLQALVDDSEEQPFAKPYTLLIDAYGAVEAIFHKSGDLETFQQILSTLLREGFQRNVYMVITSQYPVNQYEVFREILDTRQSILLPSRQDIEQRYGWEYHHGLGFLQNMPLKAFITE